jgi:hypothetical protein
MHLLKHGWAVRFRGIQKNMPHKSVQKIRKANKKSGVKEARQSTTSKKIVNNFYSKIF